MIDMKYLWQITEHVNNWYVISIYLLHKFILFSSCTGQVIELIPGDHNH